MTFSQHHQVVTGTQLEVQLVETLGTPTGFFFLGFVEGKEEGSGKILLGNEKRGSGRVLVGNKARR